MHRSNPAMSAMRAYTGGGARSVVHAADDTKLMQEMAGGFMAGEQRQAVEAPQNYGFTSVNADADKDGQGNVTGGAETFISFMGGNRSFPVATAIDDRRHRLYKLEKGDVAMFRQASDSQQLHMTTDGGFFSGPSDKTVRMQLVQKKQQQQGGSGGAQPGQHDSTGGGNGSSGGAGGQQKGQQAVYKNGQDSDFFVHITKDGTTASGVNVYLRQGGSFGGDSSSGSGGGSTRDAVELPPIDVTAPGSGGSGGSGSSSQKPFTSKSDNVKVHVADDGNVYLGGKKGDKGMLRVMVQGEQWSKNVFAMGGGGQEPPDAACLEALALAESLTARVETLAARIEALEAKARTLELA